MLSKKSSNSYCFGLSFDAVYCLSERTAAMYLEIDILENFHVDARVFGFVIRGQIDIIILDFLAQRLGMRTKVQLSGLGSHFVWLELFTFFFYPVAM